jgi:hypothetical protein
MTPAAVLAPAFGERGRELFARWATQLFAAVVSKLLFSFLLGVMLAVVAILSQLRGLGFWTEWLLTSVFWWGAFARREHILALAGGGAGLRRSNRARLLPRRVRSTAGSPGRQLIGTGRALRRLAGPAPTHATRTGFVVATRERGRARAAEQVTRSLENDFRDPLADEKDAAAARGRVASLQAQHERVTSARLRAAAGGDTRRKAELAHRATRVEADIARERQRLQDASRLADGVARRRRSAGAAYGRAQAEERARFLDAQAALPGSRDPRVAGSALRRDYGALAGLAGFTRGEYDALGPGHQRAARLEIDRELALRQAISAAVRDAARAASPSPSTRGARRRADLALEDALVKRLGNAGQRLPGSHRDRSAIGRWRAAGKATAEPAARGSRVMEDARAVADRRKRQLGFDRK